MTVLIVDDLAEYLRSLQRALSAEHTITTASSLEEAQAVIRLSIPDVALVDVRLSESEPDNRDGLRLLEWLRSYAPNLPVIMMSAYRDFEIAVDALNFGSKRFLKKPIDLRELKTLLRDLATEGNDADSSDDTRSRAR